MRAGPVLTNVGCSHSDTGYRRIAAVIVAAAFIITLVVTELASATGLEKGAELAFARARQLMHEADQEDRNVRPLPLSLAKVVYLPGSGREEFRSINSAGQEAIAASSGVAIETAGCHGLCRRLLAELAPGGITFPAYPPYESAERGNLLPLPA